MKREDFYFCYSIKLSQYLQEKGFRFIFMAKETHKDNLFSLYERTDALNDALESYRLNK